ncbi:diacylglycerol kinase family protein [Weissella muntiaci]|uniref:Diacylglycerol kinase family protein n=2 Tax=Weissella muntiaci TaxID=2508881 RepID=A0A6C2C7R0_9LACO|nr:diacylglycerol kinase family protein [Weissella muntiaci]TYC50041.1 diacylglycerol kinase family protein [Weissella muntiaci]
MTMALQDKEHTPQIEKNTNFLQALGHALEGIGQLLVRERNMRFHFLAAIVVLIFGLKVGLGRSDWLWVTVAVFTVIMAEFVNTIVESIVDLIVGDEYYTLAKVAKDVAAGAVLAAVGFAVIIGALIFEPYVWPWIKMILTR